MGELIDYEGRKTAFKILLTITIIVTALVNFGLIYRLQHLAGGFKAILTNRRSVFMTLFSIAIGDLVVTFYSLVEQALVYYETKTLSDCDTSFVFSVFYLQYIMPFVNGVGLILLVADSVYFRSQSSSHVRSQDQKVIIRNVVVGGVPWVLGLVVAVPVCNANFNFDTCLYSSTDAAYAVLSICLILPTVLVLLGALANACTSGTASNYEMPTAPTSARSTGSDIQDSTATTQPVTHPSTNIPLSPVGYEMERARHAASYISLFSSKPLAQPGYVIKYPQEHAINLDSQSSEARQMASQIPNSSPESGYIRREKAAHILAACTYFTCCMPLAVFTLAYTLNSARHEMSLLAAIVIGDLVWWLIVIRAVVMPCVWLLSGGLPRLNSSPGTGYTQ